jgi:hypothetical protein
MAKTANVKRSSYELEVETFEGKKATYLVMTKGRSIHTFLEVDSKQAATDCGSTLDHRSNTPEMMWNDLKRKRKKAA